MIEALTFLLLAQLVGEVAARGLELPVPGPVIGMVLLAVILAWRGIRDDVSLAAHGILRHLSLLFVPAGVGIVQHAGVLAEHWAILSTALAVSTLATLIVTALTFRWAARRFGANRTPMGPAE